MKRLFPLVLTLVCASLGCSTDRQPGELLAPAGEPLPVVFGRLVVGQPLPPIDVTRTLSPAQPFSRQAAAVVGAQVEVFTGARTFAYESMPGTPGRYAPVAPEAVQSETAYTLRVTLPAGGVVSATTLTPPAFAVERWVHLEGDAQTQRAVLRDYRNATQEELFAAPENQVVYADGLLEAQFDRSLDVPAFQAGLESLDPESDYVIDISEFSEDDLDLLLRHESSPPLQSAEGVIRLPWQAVYYEGRYKTKIYALDANWYDLIRSSPEFNDTGPSGSRFERPLFHVDGGIGLFGSASVDSGGFVIHPRP